MRIDIWNRRDIRGAKARRILAVAFAVSYPALAHATSLLESAALALASVVVLAAAVLFQPLIDRRRWAWIAMPLVGVAIVGLWRLDAAALVLFLPPVLLNIFLAWLFGHTLRRGSVPLIERIVRLMQPPGIPPGRAVVRYAGNLTRIWTLLFVSLGAVNGVLAACVVPGGLLDSAGLRPPLAVGRGTWSLFANVLNYLIVAVFFLLEFWYRMRRFPDRPYRNLREFLSRAAHAAPALAATWAPAAGAARPVVLETQLEVPASHPALPGHFPGRPVLPGVVLLEHVIEAAAPMLGGGERIAGLPWVKFLAPLRPRDRAGIQLRRERNQLHFEVSNAGLRVARGACRIESGRTPE
jgi:uncharacterized membrane protein/3-hydroxymyristoyl/3-hydroxydecanoyl-(acyl carrier protein) dehydratase